MPDNPQDFTPEQLVAEGRKLGKAPDAIATALQRWRGDMLNYGAAKVGDSDPNKYAAGVDRLDEDLGKALAGLRAEATKEWAKTTFGGRPQEFESFLQAVDGGDVGYAQELADFEKLQQPFKLAKRARDWHPLADGNGAEVARMQVIPRGAESDVLLNYRADDAGTMKQARVAVPEVKPEEVEAEAVAAEQRAKEARERSAAYLADAEKFMPGNTMFPSVEAYQLRSDKARAEEEKAVKEQQRAERLRSADGHQTLMGERVMEKVRGGPLGKEVGQRNLGEDFYRGMAQFFIASRVAANDLQGDTAERDEWRGHLQNLRQYYPGTTGPQNTEGVSGFVSDAAQGAGGMVPQMLAMGAGAVGNTAAKLAGGASMTAMGVSAYGAGVDEALSRADALEGQAAQIERVDARGAEQLREQAAGIRDGYRGIAAGKAAVEVGSEFILPEQRLLRPGAMGATVAKRVAGAAGKSFAEGVVAEAGGQAVNAGAFGDAYDAAQMLRGGLLETASGAPMIAASALARPGAQTPAVSPATGAGGAVADVPPPTAEQQARPEVEVVPVPESTRAETAPMIGGRPVLLAERATEAERAQLARMNAPEAAGGAGAEAPPSMAELAMNGGREEVRPAGPADATPVAQRVRVAQTRRGRADRDYLRAVEEGALENAQAMVEGVAQRAGYTLKVYHGLNYGGSDALEGGAFDFSRGRYGSGTWVSDAEAVGRRYGKRQMMALYLKPGEVFTQKDYARLPAGHPLKQQLEAMNGSAKSLDTVTDFTGAEEILRGMGYAAVAHTRPVAMDGVRGGGGAEHTAYFVFGSPGQIKSAEAVTKDEQGKVVPLSQRFNAGDGRVAFSAAGKPGAVVTGKLVRDALKLLEGRLPGLQGGRVIAVANVAELMASGYAGRDSFTAEELAGMQAAEAFFDERTGHTVIFTEQVELREGETPIRATARVLLHERVGHDGVNTLLALDPAFEARWLKLAEQIPAAALDAIAAEPGYAHLATDRAQLALEWLAREVERVMGARLARDIEGGLSGVVKQLWQALKEMLARVFSGFKREAAFAHEVHEVITLAHEAAVNGTADPVTLEGLAGRVQFSLGGTAVSHQAGTPYRVRNRAWRAIVTGSALPKCFADALEMTGNEQKSLDSASANLGELLKAAVEKVAKKQGMPLADVYAFANDHFDGKPGAMAVMMQLDEGLAEAARRCRNHVDNLSDAIRATLPAGPLQAVIAGNLGSWMRRGYAAFDPASGWSFEGLMQAAKDKKQVGGKDAGKILKDAAVYLANQDPSLLGMRDPQTGLPKADTLLHSAMKRLMDRDEWSAALTGGAVSKNVSSLMRRKDIAPEIRALMGEETNALKRYIQSTGFQTQFIARHQGQRTMRDIGLKADLFRTAEGGDFTVQIPPDNHRWSGMGGVWTTPELWAALQEPMGADLMSANAWGVIGQGLQWMHSTAKRNNVAFNPFSWLVNVAGGVTGLIQTGDLALMHPAAWKTFRLLAEAKSILKAGKVKQKDVKDAASIAAKDTFRQTLARLQAGGIVGNQVDLAQLQDMMPRHLLMYLERTEHGDKAHGAVQGALLGNAVGRGFGGLGQIGGTLVGAAAGWHVGGGKIQDIQERIAGYMLAGPDNMAKTVTWLRNFETAMKAGLPQDKAAEQAHVRTLATMPNYGAMWAPLRTASRLLGAPGSFTAFLYEVYRNFGKNIQIGVQDVRSGNPALVADGMQRLMGAATCTTLALSGVGAVLSLVCGSTPPDDERNKKWRKWFAAPWEKDAGLHFTDYSEKGVSYVAQTYLIPQASIAELVNAALSGDEEDMGATKALLRLWSQAGGGDSIHLTPIMQAWSNTNAFGQPVTEEAGLVGVLRRIDHAAKTIGDPKAVQVLWKFKAALTGENFEGKPQSLDSIGKNMVAVRERTQTWDDLLHRAYRSFGDEHQRLKNVVRERIKRGADPATELTWVNGEIVKLQARLKEFEGDLPEMKVPAGLARQKRKQSSIGTLSTVKLTTDRKGVVAD